MQKWGEMVCQARSRISIEEHVCHACDIGLANASLDVIKKRLRTIIANKNTSQTEQTSAFERMEEIFGSDHNEQIREITLLHYLQRMFCTIRWLITACEVQERYLEALECMLNGLRKRSGQHMTSTHFPSEPLLHNPIVNH